MALVMTKPSDSPSHGPNKFHSHQKTRTDRVDVNALPCRPADEPVEVPLSFRGWHDTRIRHHDRGSASMSFILSVSLVVYSGSTYTPPVTPQYQIHSHDGPVRGVSYSRILREYSSRYITIYLKRLMLTSSKLADPSIGSLHGFTWCPNTYQECLVDSETC